VNIMMGLFMFEDVECGDMFTIFDVIPWAFFVSQ